MIRNHPYQRNYQASQESSSETPLTIPGSPSPPASPNEAYLHYAKEEAELACLAAEAQEEEYWNDREVGDIIADNKDTDPVRYEEFLRYRRQSKALADKCDKAFEAVVKVQTELNRRLTLRGHPLRQFRELEKMREERFTKKPTYPPLV